MICKNCSGPIQYYDYIMLEEMNQDEANLQLHFCGYQCLKYWFRWRDV